MNDKPPKSLFHGTPVTEFDPAIDPERIMPASFKVRSPHEGPVIFATPNKAAAMKNLM